MRRILLIMLALVSLVSLAWAHEDQPYEYPIVNPYEATVVGTPDLYKALLPERIPVETIEMTVVKDREVPDVYWYWDTCR